jgi:hypothetical protein
MRKVVDDGPDCEPAMHMKGRLKPALREKASVDASNAARFDIDEHARAAFAAGDARIALQFPIRRIAADDLDRVGGIDGFRNIGAAMHGLAVVAMAVELHDRLGGDLDLGRPAAASDLGHSFCSGSGRRLGQHPCHALTPVGALSAEMLHNRSIEAQRHGLQRLIELRPAGTALYALSQTRKRFGKRS